VVWIAVRLASLIVCALSLGLSFAHLLEAPPRLRVWPPELWRETTVFHGQYSLFGAVGGPIDVAAVVLTLALAWSAWRTGRSVAAATTAAALFALSLAVWLSVVAPANHVLVTWKPGPLPADFAAIRARWETGHMVMAWIKLAGFVALSLADLAPSRRR
jgi:hypothetical protein